MQPAEEQRQRAREIGDWICRKPAAVSLEMTAEALQSEYERGKRDGAIRAAEVCEGITDEYACDCRGVSARAIRAEFRLEEK